jgi:nitrogen fixation/metabolism regulation signal transduction histidine kinase
LEVLRRRHFETSVTAIEAVDLDRHGRPEILSVTGRNSVLVLGADLKQVAELTLPEPFSLLLPPVRAPGATGLVIADVSARPDDRVALHSVYNVVPVPVQLPVWVFIAAIAGVLLVSVLVVFAVSSGYRAQMNSMLRGLVKGAGVVRLNPQGRVTSMNREARELLGVPGMLSNRDFARVCREQSLPLLGAFVSSGVASEERSHSSELAFSAGEGETRRNLLARLVRLRRGSILTVEDISAVEYLKRVQTWIPVARRLAHSIKNPLTAMNLNIRQIEKRQGDGEDRAGQYLRSMKEEVTRLHGMTDGFMKLTRLEEPILEPSDIRQVVRAALEKLASTGSDSIRLAERYEDGLPPVMLDAEQMLMAVSNVVENAVAAMEGRGTLTVAASSDQPGRVRLDVTDTGPGIPDEFLERLFEPYFTLKKGGTGLGMAITKKVVEDHHGEIRVTSRAGEGTTVSILIPAAESGSGTESARG